MVNGIEEKNIYELLGVESTAYEIGDGDYTVAVLAENHGDEQGPREVFDDIFSDMPFRHGNLSLSYIPEANAFAHRETSRKTPRSFQPNAADQHDLNHSYETARKEMENGGNLQHLNTTQQAAFRILEYLEELDPDLIVDMHSGTSGTSKMPQIRYKDREEYPAEEMRGVAENAGVDLISTDVGENSGVFGAVAPEMGYPAVTVEVGGGVEFGHEHSFQNSEVETYEEIIGNIFDYALSGEETDFNPREFTALQKNFSPVREPARVEYHFPLGEEVFEDETVATLETRSGDEIRLNATTDGALETVLTEDMRDEVKPGNRVFNLALRE